MKTKKKRKNKKSNRLVFISIAALILIVIIISVIFVSRPSNSFTSVSNEYYIGTINSYNAAANIVDYLNKKDNIVISPLNANISLAMIYNATDNNSTKEIKRYFKTDVGSLNTKYQETIKNLNEKETITLNKNYQKYLKIIYENEYDKLRIRDLDKLTQKEKETLLLILIKTELYFNQANNRYSSKEIEKYKLSDKERKYNSYTIKSMIEKILVKDEQANLINEVHNYNELFYNSNNSSKINNNFKKNIKTYYSANVTGISFNKDYKKEINKQIDIELDDDLQNNNLISINSLTFNYEWKENFAPNNTTDEEFIGFDGKHYLVDMMHSQEAYYLENDMAVGFIKEFENDRYIFVGILPRQEGTFSLSNLNIDGLIESKKETKVNVGLPKFSYTSTIDLKEMYKYYEIETLYNYRANLHQMTDLDYIVSTHLQKESITIGEYGTTQVTSKSSEMSVQIIDDELKRIELNRPFVFLIIDTETNDVLQIGLFQKPSN